MRKIVVIVLVVMLITAMTVPAFAANIVPIGKTVSFKMPSIKTVDVPYSTVYENAKTAIKSNIINNLYKAYSFGR